MEKISTPGKGNHEIIPESPKKNTKKIVTFNDRDHLAILTQMYGSVWPRVLPFCVINAFNTGVLYHVVKISRFSFIAIDPTGHKFMTALVAFVVVTRTKIVYARFMEARKALELMIRSCTELIQIMCVITQPDQSPEAKKWRRDVAKRVIVLLRVTIAALEYDSSRENPWDVIELDDDDRIDCNYFNVSMGSSRSLDTNASCLRTELTNECFRSPITLIYRLRETFMSQRQNEALHKRLFFRHPCNEEFRCLEHSSDYLKGYHMAVDLITTPFPFPLVQMARTFMFLWVFTLPLALIGSDYGVAGIVSLIFILTYGFLGLEYVSMELDDPFGDDPNDFNDMEMAKMAFEDIYITMLRTDGIHYTKELRQMVERRNGQQLSTISYV